jgi:predicted membrane protein
MKLQKLFIGSLIVFALIYILIYIFNKPKIDNDGNKEELERNYKTSSVYFTKDDMINKVEEKASNISQINVINNIEDVILDLTLVLFYLFC